jgi:hypothetical protein
MGSSGRVRIAIEATEVHWGVEGSGGSRIRRKEEAAIRVGRPWGCFVPTDSVSDIVRALESKCGKRYRLDRGEDLWLLLLGGSPAAPVSTWIFRPDLAQLNGRTHSLLSHSRFSRCYLFCELTVPGPTVYGWDATSSWLQIAPTPAVSGPTRPTASRALPSIRGPVPHYIA